MNKNINVMMACALIISPITVVVMDDALGQNTQSSTFTGPDEQHNDFVLKDRDLVMRGADGLPRFRLDGQTGNFVILNKHRKVVTLMEARGANLSLGEGVAKARA